MILMETATSQKKQLNQMHRPQFSIQILDLKFNGQIFVSCIREMLIQKSNLKIRGLHLVQHLTIVRNTFLKRNIQNLAHKRVIHELIHAINKWTVKKFPWTLQKVSRTANVLEIFISTQNVESTAAPPMSGFPPPPTCPLPPIEKKNVHRAAIFLVFFLKSTFVTTLK